MIDCSTEVHEREMVSNKISDYYAYTFTPDKHQRSFKHQFAVKAFSLDYGWGDYSEDYLAKTCECYLSLSLSHLQCCGGKIPSCCLVWKILWEANALRSLQVACIETLTHVEFVDIEHH